MTRTPTIHAGHLSHANRPWIWFCLALSILAPLCNAYEVFGRVVGVTDGDTLTVLDTLKQQHKIRLYGIDAPEKAQPFGTVAKQDLSMLAFGKDVRVDVTGKDRYGREIGKVYVLIGDWYKPDPGEVAPRDIYVNLQLLQQGSAWHYTQYSRDVDLAGAEKVARSAKLGLWGIGDPVPPWDWRKGERSRKSEEATAGKVQQPQSGTGSYWLNTSSNVRHNAGCKYFKKTKRGKLCGPNDGKACGICGG